MTLTQLPTTYVSQLNRPANRSLLESYRDSGDRSPNTFAKYYFDIINILKNTPAWGKPKTNQMLNELTYKVRATLGGSKKKGKSSAVAHANTLISTIEWCSKTEASGCFWTPVKLESLLTKEEVEQLLSIINTSEDVK